MRSFRASTQEDTYRGVLSTVCVQTLVMQAPPFTVAMLPSVITHLNYVFVTRCIQAASLALLAYDHVLTFTDEVDFVWMGVHSRSWPRMLFFSARYMPFIALLINSSGNNWLLYQGWTGLLLFGGVQIISQMRIWAVYKSQKILIANGVLIFAGLAAMGLIEGLAYRHLVATNFHIITPVCGPPLSGLPSYVYAFWIPPIILETVAFFLVLYKAVEYYRSEVPKDWVTARFMAAITRYSVTYFLIALMVYLGNFIIWKCLEVPAYEILLPLTFALPSIAGNRMLLNLRAIFYRTHSLAPGKEMLCMRIINESDRGVVIRAQEGFNEFESFFGGEGQGKDQFMPNTMLPLPNLVHSITTNVQVENYMDI
ncbi:hypothetical protein M422DRAFT_778302 [Sphaerobolus stellatus SS14]|uniref:DUF6533 domain-containing protein n=1 Tax=Sphaerobolus stellatus (strain SS14) TaxID=990650 RepID=A0A0C9VHU3_SPHS4|nr:hypothetical protein M422DRAFT_778302 [Sphaerobolus stellatus SS14]